MKKILRLTRHPIDDTQLGELCRIFGEVEVITITENVANVQRIAEIVKENEADVLDVVLPLPLMADVLNSRNGITATVIRAVMNRKLNDAQEAVFTFDHYEKVVKVEVQTERL